MKKDYALIALGALGAFILWQTFRSKDSGSSSWVNSMRSRFGFQREGAGAVQRKPATGTAGAAAQALEQKMLEQRLSK